MSALSYLLVDGHSVMHAWPELKRDQRSASRRHLARLELMKRLRTYQDMTGKQVVLVFDGTHSQRSEEREPEGLQVIYAEATTTADAIIERLASRYARQHPMQVVSADGMVRETILACGADWTSPEMLKSMCEDAERRLGDEISKRR
ncbi:putative RNA-binding protein with PIN domain [Prosthecobacter fusiformis]|uniref:Putative RNA-binding protein with PIN domain n=1 Tax=Prosthecobacter fusiformis TaxID=48464 RepID=A0A4R7SNH9_9BACT|nr:NYN domain-containing protein [Prosthecobacter fusiformis]TDU80722.1 putative RNA-binding protein with PIN domain [Prosthecobacter fusiformis]